MDEYNILQDIKDQKANVTIGQLLHDNVNYQKLIRDAWTKRRKRRLKLPSVAVNFSQMEDYGAPELEVEIGGCMVPRVPVDGGSGINLMLEDTAFDLGYISFQATDQVLRMADQSRVHPVGRLLKIPTRIGKETYLLNYVIIQVTKGRPFSMLLVRPWLYMARALVDWGSKEFVVGKPAIRIPWKHTDHLEETSESDGYTTDWSDPEESDSVLSYFTSLTETDFAFPEPIVEVATEESFLDISDIQPEDRSLGETDVPLTYNWIRRQVMEESFPAIGLSGSNMDIPWGEFHTTTEETGPERIKAIVNPSDYEKVKLDSGTSFFMSKSMTAVEKEAYGKLLEEYLDVFAWTPSDLSGIPAELGEHQID